MSKRFYAAYTDWEDFKSGMYGSELRVDFVEKSITLLSNRRKLSDLMMKVIKEWDISTKQNLTNTSNNCKSWLGQAACCLNHSANELETRTAWKKLNVDQQRDANDVAKQVIDYWDLMNSFNRKGNVKEIFGY